MARGFASGLLAGSQMASRWVDTYNAGQDRREREALKTDLQGIQNAEVQENMQFSPQQAIRLGELGTQGADVQWDDTLRGYHASQPVPVDGVGPSANQEFIAPQRDYSFLGQQYAARPSDTEVRYARRGAIADRIGIDNPELGARMQLQAGKQLEFDTEQDTKRQTKALEEQAKTFMKDTSVEDLVGQLGGIINPSDMPGMLNYDKKSGGATMIYSLGDRTYTANLTPAQVKDYAYQAFISGQGDIARGLPSLVASLQGAQETDAKGRKAALEMRNVESQIEDRAAGQRVRQQTADQAGRYQEGLLTQGAARIRLAEDEARGKTNPPPNTTVKLDDVERSQITAIDNDIRSLTAQVNAGLMSPDEAATRRSELTQQRQGVLRGAQARTLVSSASQMVQAQLKDDVPADVIVRQMQEAKLPQEVIERFFPQAGAAPTPEPSTSAPSAPASAPAPTTARTPAPAPVQSRAPRRAPAPTPAQPTVSREERVARAFGATGRGGSLDGMAQRDARALLELDEQLRTEQARMAAVARSGDPQAIARQQGILSAVGRGIDNLLSQMNESQKAAIMRELGQR